MRESIQFNGAMDFLVDVGNQNYVFGDCGGSVGTSTTFGQQRNYAAVVIFVFWIFIVQSKPKNMYILYIYIYIVIFINLVPGFVISPRLNRHTAGPLIQPQPGRTNGAASCGFFCCEDRWLTSVDVLTDTERQRRYKLLRTNVSYPFRARPVRLVEIERYRKSCWIDMGTYRKSVLTQIIFACKASSYYTVTARWLAEDSSCVKWLITERGHLSKKHIKTVHFWKKWSMVVCRDVKLRCKRKAECSFLFPCERNHMASS